MSVAHVKDTTATSVDAFLSSSFSEGKHKGADRERITIEREEGIVLYGLDPEKTFFLLPSSLFYFHRRSLWPLEEKKKERGGES